MKAYFKKKITSKKEAITFIRCLHEDDKLFHLEDDPAEIITMAPGGSANTFTKPEIILLRQRVAEVFTHHEDPLAVCVALLNGEDPETTGHDYTVHNLLNPAWRDEVAIDTFTTTLDDEGLIKLAVGAAVIDHYGLDEDMLHDVNLAPVGVNENGVTYVFTAHFNNEEDKAEMVVMLIQP